MEWSGGGARGRGVCVGGQQALPARQGRRGVLLCEAREEVWAWRVRVHIGVQVPVRVHVREGVRECVREGEHEHEGEGERGQGVNEEAVGVALLAATAWKALLCSVLHCSGLSTSAPEEAGVVAADEVHVQVQVQVQVRECERD